MLRKLAATAALTIAAAALAAAPASAGIGGNGGQFADGTTAQTIKDTWSKGQLGTALRK